MPDAEKQALIELAALHDIPVIDDDAFGELDFNRRERLCLKSFDHDHVLHVGTLSNTLAPGYRLGWLEPGKYARLITASYHFHAMAASAPVEMALASFLRHGSYSHHLRRLKKHLASNLELFVKVIEESFPPGTTLIKPVGGIFIWLCLPESIDSVLLSEASLAQGITLAPGRLFSSRDNYSNYLRLNFALQWEPAIEKALRTVGGLAREIREGAR